MYMAVSSKPFWRSSTILINLAGIVVLLISFVIQSNLIPDADVVAILVAIANILNRFRAPAKIQSLTIK